MKTDIEKLKEVKDIKSSKSIIGYGLIWLIKKIILDHDKRISDLEVEVARLKGEVEDE